ncbi:glycosyltransferase [Clostridium perfringens]|uniref:glycosyltransferase n=1 Tax=Clostridium perfringens TaxID=1502 RepID=UPI00210E0665|nr:glycosyltransferase [Clostridium perfringens]
MNILYISNSIHLGGDTKCILKLAKEFKKKGNTIFLASNDGVMKSEFEKIGVKNIKINDVEDKSITNIIKIIFQVRRILKKNKIDVIHSHHRMTTLISKLASIGLNIKIIHTQHLCIDDKYKLTNIALRNTSIVTVSNEAKNILIKKSRLDSKKITTIYNTIENENNIDEEIDQRLIELKQKGYFLVGQVSRVIDYKGIYDFVDIAEITIAENDNIRFIFIGDGPDFEKMREYIIKKRLKDKVILLGSKNNVIKHLEFLDLFILCSYIEGLPLTPIEAFSQKIPVIGTNIGGTNEEIKDGLNGYLVDKKDILGFKEKIIYMYNNIDILDKMGKNAFEIYNNKFNSNVYCEKHEHLYKF